MVLYAIILFFSCVSFPIGNAFYPEDFMELYLLLSIVSIQGLLFAAVFEEGREKTVFLTSFFFTSLGMAARFLIEFGEVSNTLNFTP